MSLQQILQKNREQLAWALTTLEQGFYEENLEYVSEHLKEILQALYDEEKELRPVKCDKGCAYCDRGLQRKCNTYLEDKAWNDAKQDTLNRLKSIIDSL